MIKLLNAEESRLIDVALMGEEYGFSNDQLMEMAGMSVAHSCVQTFPLSQFSPKFLVICGPQNNGGDGLVAARHLKHFGYEPVILYPKKESAEKDLFKRLILQCTTLGISIYFSLSELLQNYSLTDFTFILDAIFGYSFSGKSGIREPFKTVIETVKKPEYSSIPIVCIDIPSGWEIDIIDVDENLKLGLRCDILVSLPSPKLCSLNFRGRHFIGGRFMPPQLLKKFGVDLPPYKGTDIIMEISSDMLKMPSTD
ncbi:hypothetical protein C9374_010413 [Naegleria lovaniensis]|uniref:NAD(P)H-hydrate epimerase n=1 Tax=Naegleria lovaniensis TaxID=51637 RepID=A0AA88GIN7_NAELO|nr:uncharacterized protein C9374_010413 [Naegleria lovaniensis]KAG2374836.1 hypothetical protein C9374_010413 [Naegleria lovaniensis]